MNTAGRLTTNIETIAKIANVLDGIGIEVNDGAILSMARVALDQAANTGNPVSKWLRRRRLRGWDWTARVLESFNAARRSPLDDVVLPCSASEGAANEIEDVANNIVSVQRNGGKTTLQGVWKMIKVAGIPVIVDNLLAIAGAVEKKRPRD